MPILKPDKEKEKRPRVLLIPPPDLPVPAVQGGAGPVGSVVRQRA